MAIYKGREVYIENTVEAGPGQLRIVPYGRPQDAEIVDADKVALTTEEKDQLKKGGADYYRLIDENTVMPQNVEYKSEGKVVRKDDKQIEAEQKAMADKNAKSVEAANAAPVKVVADTSKDKTVTPTPAPIVPIKETIKK